MLGIKMNGVSTSSCIPNTAIKTKLVQSKTLVLNWACTMLFLCIQTFEMWQCFMLTAKYNMLIQLKTPLCPLSILGISPSSYQRQIKWRHICIQCQKIYTVVFRLYSMIWWPGKDGPNHVLAVKLFHMLPEIPTKFKAHIE